MVAAREISSLLPTVSLVVSKAHTHEASADLTLIGKAERMVPEVPRGAEAAMLGD